MEIPNIFLVPASLDCSCVGGKTAFSKIVVRKKATSKGPNHSNRIL